MNSVCNACAVCATLMALTSGEFGGGNHEVGQIARFSGSTCHAPFGGRMMQFDYCAQVHKAVSVYYRLNRHNVETLVHAQIKDGWIGFGWGYRAMKGSNAVVAYKDPSGKIQVADYFLAFKGKHGVRPEGRQALTTKRAEATADSISALFARPLAAVGQVPSLNTTSGKNPLIWAFGAKASVLGELSHHTARGWTEVEFPKTSTATVASFSKGFSGFSLSLTGPFALHGMLMAGAFVVLIPAALAVMRAKSRPKMAFRAHRLFNTLALGCAASGLTVAVINGSHTYHAHMAVGGFALVLAFAQPITYLRRPDQGSVAHISWRSFHAGAGRLALILGLTNVFIGLHIFTAGWVGYSLVVLILLGFIGLSVMMRRGLEHQLLPGEEEIIDERSAEITAAQLAADNAQLAAQLSKQRAALNKSVPSEVLIESG